jgi:ADP-ribose pyrophosphatase YjhB (NUDIX family)
MTENTPPALLARLLALSRTGLHYAGQQYRGSDPNSVFDRERYEEIGSIAAQLLGSLSVVPVAELIQAWRADDGYITPKIDVRGAAFRDGKVLLVRERSDGKWTLPGGWADVNETPAQSIEKEISQESGFTAKAVKLAAVYDRNKRNPPPAVFHWWKFFFLCEITGGAAQTSSETDGVDFFALDALPELSRGRANEWQIGRMFAHHRDQSLPTEFD